MPDIHKLDFGLVAEGIVELDPMSGRLVVRVPTDKGNEFFDVQEYLLKYKGQEVRCIITPFSTINTVARMVEEGDVSLDAVPKVPRFSA